MKYLLNKKVLNFLEICFYVFLFEWDGVGRNRIWIDIFCDVDY